MAQAMETTSPRRPKPKRSRSSLRVLQSTVGIAVLLATLFTALPSRGLVSGDFYNRLSVVLTPRPVDGLESAAQPQLRIGIVSGHAGNDPGAVCVDGNGQVTLTEADVNLEIAAIVQQKLIEAGYQVDLLREFDSRLNGYRALAIVSIHNDSC